jgi:prepilin-type processing-associated H-X9-DG protein
MVAGRRSYGKCRIIKQMKMAHRILAVTVLVIINVTLVARADNANLKELLSGKQVPLALKLKDLDGSWRRTRVSSPDSNALLGMYAQIMGGSGGGVYYTKGETVVLDGLTFIIAYQHLTKPVDTTALFRGGTPPETEPLTPESPLALALIQLRTAGTLGDIRPFNLDEEIAEQAGVRQAVEGAQDRNVNLNSVNNLKQIGIGLAMYTDDNNKKYPDLSDSQSMKKALARYITNEKVFVHPKTGKPFQPNSSLSGKEAGWPNPPADLVVVYEDEPAENGTRAVLFGDGHVERVSETRWQELKKTSNIP